MKPLNTQPIERQRWEGTSSSVDLHSMFYTIQGEGPFSGRPSVFIRLAGCNLQCPMCDTEYTEGRKMTGADEVAIKALSLWNTNLYLPENYKRPLIVITGGEPFRQELGKLLTYLIGMRATVQIETNGVLPPSEDTASVLRLFRDQIHVVVSPKTSRIADYWQERAMAFKYVLEAGQINPEDGLPLKALGHKASPQVARPDYTRFRGGVYVNPMDAHQGAENNKANLLAVVESSLRFGYTAGIQLHKILELE